MALKMLRASWTVTQLLRLLPDFMRWFLFHVHKDCFVIINDLFVIIF